MAILITVEDGTIVANANSYISVAEARTYAENRGVVLPVDNDKVAAMLIQATDFLESKCCLYAGTKTDPAQSLEWPRTDAYILGGEPYDSHTIPKNLKSAQAAAVIAVSQGLSLLPNITAQDYVIEETVGPITTKYANPIQTGIDTQFTGVDSLLAPLYGNCGQTNGFSLRTIRV